MRFVSDPEGVVRRLRELLMGTLQQSELQHEVNAVLSVGTPDGVRTAPLDPGLIQDAIQSLVGELITVERLEAALRRLPLEAAERAIVAGCAEADSEADQVVAELGALSDGAQTLAFVRLMSPGDNLLVDPVEVAARAEAGSAEFTSGWWEIRSTLAEPARQWVELLEGRFPKARR
jgi:hypothetical protein